VITGVGTVVLYVSDQQRSVDFYVGKLGWEKVTDGEMWPGARWIEVAPAGAETRVALLLPDPGFEGAKVGGPAPATLVADDVRATYEQLKSQGVAVTEPVEEPWSTYIKVTDPDGHEFVVGQPQS
jgi:catechol 2,3-dioxygenase-like lactoylglutathione lyase family enzyme